MSPHHLPYRGSHYRYRNRSSFLDYDNDYDSDYDSAAHRSGLFTLSLDNFTHIKYHTYYSSSIGT